MAWAFPLSSSEITLALLDVLGRAAYLVAILLLALLVVVFSFIQSRALYGSDEPARQRVNCPSCGARTPAESETCDHCGEPIHR